MLSNGRANTNQRAEIGDVGFIDWRRHCDDQKVGTGKAPRVASGFKATGPEGSFEVFGANFAGRVNVILVGLNLRLGKIIANGQIFLTEFDGQRETDVSKADHCNDRIFGKFFDFMIHENSSM
jgi:hypothetical protein